MDEPEPTAKRGKSKGLSGAALERAVLRMIAADASIVATSQQLPDGTLTEPQPISPQEVAAMAAPLLRPEPAKRGRRRAIAEDDIPRLYERAKERLRREHMVVTDETISQAIGEIIREEGGPPDFYLSPFTIRDYRRKGLTKAA